MAFLIFAQKIVEDAVENNKDTLFAGAADVLLHTLEGSADRIGEDLTKDMLRIGRKVCRRSGSSTSPFWSCSSCRSKVPFLSSGLDRLLVTIRRRHCSQSRVYQKWLKYILPPPPSGEHIAVVHRLEYSFLLFLQCCLKIIYCVLYVSYLPPSNFFKDRNYPIIFSVVDIQLEADRQR